jgi:hypothetical protein
MVVKTRNAQERILLGAADDQPRDDMDDSHGWLNSMGKPPITPAVF